MKRTEYELCCGTRNGYPVYRTVFEKDGRYFVKWNNQIIDVTNDKNDFERK